MKAFENVIKNFGIDTEELTVAPVHQGLINNTWKISAAGREYILQKINNKVFKQPEDIAYNISVIADHLTNKNPAYIFTSPLKTLEGNPLVIIEGNYYRMFSFIASSHTKNTVGNPSQAYEAAKQFGKFTAMLNDFDPADLKITIPSFHDLSLRYEQFLLALQDGNKNRAGEAKELIQQLMDWSHIKDEYEKIKLSPDFKLRVTHHDTKISNILFDDIDKGICVIDLDTVMPGYFISDVGDMMRTYLSPVSEEEQDMSRIRVRKEIYDAIMEGYMSEMKSELTEVEKDHFFYAGCFMIYMQALRFMTDYLNNDVYYGAAYPQHNLTRAKNQVVLLESLLSLQEVSDPSFS